MKSAICAGLLPDSNSNQSQFRQVNRHYLGFKSMAATAEFLTPMQREFWTTTSDNDGDEVAFKLANLFSFAIQSRLYADAGALVFL